MGFLPSASSALLSPWSLLLVPVLGFGQAIPLGIMHRMLDVPPETPVADAGPYSRRCLEELEKVAVEAKEIAPFAWGDIQGKVAKDLHDEPRAQYSMEAEKFSARAVVLTVITNAIANVLPLGTYHVYRGVLNIQGHQLHALFGWAVSGIEQAGSMTSEKANEERAWIRRQIASAG